MMPHTRFEAAMIGFMLGLAVAATIVAMIDALQGFLP